MRGRARAEQESTHRRSHGGFHEGLKTKIKAMKYVAVICLLLLGCSRTSPTASLSANPASVSGWVRDPDSKSINASRVSIDQGAGKVDPSGSKQICPEITTKYTITAAGDGGSGTAATTVSLTAPFTRESWSSRKQRCSNLPSRAEAGGEGERTKEYREQAKEGNGPRRSGDDHRLHRQRREPADNLALSLRRAEAVRD